MALGTMSKIHKPVDVDRDGWKLSRTATLEEQGVGNP